MFTAVTFCRLLVHMTVLTFATNKIKEEMKEKSGLISQIRGRNPLLEVMQLINDRLTCTAY